MKITIQETKTGKDIPAQILKANKKDMPLKKDGWQFNWRELYKDEEAMFFKLVTLNAPKVIQGMIMLTVKYGNMLYMNNIEVAPHNYRTKKKYEKTAGCLIAYGCLLSFELGKDGYKGVLVFDSKTALISLYQNKYKATLIRAPRMFIGDINSKFLITEFLNISDDD